MRQTLPKMRWHGDAHLLLSEKPLPEGENVLLLQSELLSNARISHGFSTRRGGVSEGPFSSMNLSFTRGDDSERVGRNFQRMAKVLGTEADHFVLTHQTHTTTVRIVTEEDLGKGVTRERDYRDVDALVTDIPGVFLGVFWADCVPVLFYDPEKKVVAAAHSGWRGTVGRISRNVVQKMQTQFGSAPGDILAVIGPSICQDCYEVSEDVAEQFRAAFPGQEGILREGRRVLLSGNAGFFEEETEAGAMGNAAESTAWEQKYQLNLWEAVRTTLLEAGLREANIALGNTCTRCNSELLFSHRMHGEARGNNGAFIGLRGQ